MRNGPALVRTWGGLGPLPFPEGKGRGPTPCLPSLSAKRRLWTNRTMTNTPSIDMSDTLHYIIFYSGLSKKKLLGPPLWRHKSETNYIIMSGYDCRNKCVLSFFPEHRQWWSRSDWALSSYIIQILHTLVDTRTNSMRINTHHLKSSQNQSKFGFGAKRRLV